MNQLADWLNKFQLAFPKFVQLLAILKEIAWIFGLGVASLAIHNAPPVLKVPAVGVGFDLSWFSSINLPALIAAVLGLVAAIKALLAVLGASKAASNAVLDAVATRIAAKTGAAK